ncbi:hypothetical protein QCA50_018025 [Cerrena zonata]|uniref:Uncharacterized protein n=1 Tax=Cerrena zonata TaxID=2478898 RepID=A0AAW0FBT7_9APHY
MGSFSVVPAHVPYFDSGSQTSTAPFNVFPFTHLPDTTSADRKGNARETPAIPPPKFTPNSPEARPSDSSAAA